MINGTISQGFNMATYPPKHGDVKIASAIKELSRLKYGKTKEVIEREIVERSQLKTSLGEL